VLLWVLLAGSPLGIGGDGKRDDHRITGLTRLFLRRRHRHLRRPPPGAPPDALAPALDAQPPRIHAIAFGVDKLIERDGATLADIDRDPVDLPKIWIDVQGLADVELIRALGQRHGLHPLTIADIVHVDQRPKIETHDDHLFIVLRLPHHDDRLFTEQISMVLGHGFVLTFQERPGDCFDPVRARLRHAAGPMRQRDPDYLAYALIDALIDSYFPILERLGEQVEELEEQVIGEPQPEHVVAIHHAKRELLELRRVLWPQREVINVLLHEGTPCIEPATRPFLRDCADHVFQLLDMLEIHREIASGLLDLHLSSLSTRMNEIMKVLTIIATIFIPLGFIAGLYGMNFDPDVSPFNMPELEWRFGYPYALALMATVALGLLGYFYRKGWIGDRRRRSGDDDRPDAPR
jgi:magnesium transporter